MSVWESVRRCKSTDTAVGNKKTKNAKDIARKVMSMTCRWIYKKGRSKR